LPSLDGLYFNGIFISVFLIFYLRLGKATLIFFIASVILNYFCYQKK